MSEVIQTLSKGKNFPKNRTEEYDEIKWLRSDKGNITIHGVVQGVESRMTDAQFLEYWGVEKPAPQQPVEAIYRNNKKAELVTITGAIDHPGPKGKILMLAGKRILERDKLEWVVKPESQNDLESQVAQLQEQNAAKDAQIAELQNRLSESTAALQQATQLMQELKKQMAKYDPQAAAEIDKKAAAITATQEKQDDKTPWYRKLASPVMRLFRRGEISENSPEEMEESDAADPKPPAKNIRGAPALAMWLREKGAAPVPTAEDDPAEEEADDSTPEDMSWIKKSRVAVDVKRVPDNKEIIVDPSWFKEPKLAVIDGKYYVQLFRGGPGYDSAPPGESKLVEYSAYKKNHAFAFGEESVMTTQAEDRAARNKKDSNKTVVTSANKSSDGKAGTRKVKTTIREKMRYVPQRAFVELQSRPAKSFLGAIAILAGIGVIYGSLKTGHHHNSEILAQNPDLVDKDTMNSSLNLNFDKTKHYIDIKSSQIQQQIDQNQEILLRSERAAASDHARQLLDHSSLQQQIDQNQSLILRTEHAAAADHARLTLENKELQQQIEQNERLITNLRHMHEVGNANATNLHSHTEILGSYHSDGGYAGYDTGTIWEHTARDLGRQLGYKPSYSQIERATQYVLDRNQLGWGQAASLPDNFRFVMPDSFPSWVISGR